MFFPVALGAFFGLELWIERVEMAAIPPGTWGVHRGGRRAAGVAGLYRTRLSPRPRERWLGL